MPRRGSPYGPSYERYRAWLAREPQPCRYGCGNQATSGDHLPPLSSHITPHVEGSGCCVLVPACLPCQKSQGGRIRAGKPTPTPSRLW